MPRFGAYDKHSSNGKTKPCLDCPALIPAYGGKARCAPHSYDHAARLKRERGKRRLRRAMGVPKTQFQASVWSKNPAFPPKIRP